MLIVFNLAQLSAIFISFIDVGFLLAYLLKSLSFKILFIILTISKNPIFPFKNEWTRTSLAAFTIIGVENPNVKHLLISFTAGKFVKLTFWKLRLFRLFNSIFDILSYFSIHSFTLEWCASRNAQLFFHSWFLTFSYILQKVISSRQNHSFEILGRRFGDRNIWSWAFVFDKVAIVENLKAWFKSQLIFENAA